MWFVNGSRKMADLRQFLAGLSLLVVWCFIVPRSDSLTAPDLNNCALNESSPFSFVVKIWDVVRGRSVWSKKETSYAFGAFISSTRALSTAWFFMKRMKSPDFKKLGGFQRFKVQGQNLWDTRNVPAAYLHLCYQHRWAEHVEVHPKAREPGTRVFFDFSIVTVPVEFEVSSRKFPSIMINNNPLAMLMSIRYVNTMAEKVTCAILIPSTRHLPQYTFFFNLRIDFEAIRFWGQCIRQLCEQDRPLPIQDKCEKIFRQMTRGTMMCMVPVSKSELASDPKITKVIYEGLPLVCNQTSLGLTAQIKPRYGADTRPIFFINTFLRVYPWLVDQLYPTTASTAKETYTYKRVEFTPPSRLPTPDWGDDFTKFAANEDLPNVKTHSRTPASIFRPPDVFWKILIIAHTLDAGV